MRKTTLILLLLVLTVACGGRAQENGQREAPAPEVTEAVAGGFAARLSEAALSLTKDFVVYDPAYFRGCLEFFAEAILGSFLFHLASKTRCIMALCNEFQALNGAKRAQKGERENFETTSQYPLPRRRCAGEQGGVYRCGDPGLPQAGD